MRRASQVESPEERQARERERQIAQVERNTATQETAAGETQDLAAVYRPRKTAARRGQSFFEMLR